MKAKFCRLFADLGNATAAARGAGYSSPNVKGSTLLKKDATGAYKDKSIAAELARLRGAVNAPAQALAVPVTQFATMDEVERTLKQTLLEMALDEKTSAGPRVQATVALLKAIGADVPKRSDDKDDKAAAREMHRLLGLPFKED